MTHLLLVNPNMSQTLTDRLARVARAAAPAGAEITALTAERGFPYISSRAEAQVSGEIALTMIAERLAAAERGLAPAVDGVVIAAFGDPGLRPARELFDIPVVGMAEASMLTACMLGDRFSIVTFTPRMRPWYRESVVAAGLESRFAGFRTPRAAIGPVSDVADTMREEICEAARLAADEDGADVVILGGAPLAGLAATLAGLTPATPLDPVSAAVAQASVLARLAPGGAAHGAYARPPAKPSRGLADPLADWIAEGAEADA